MNAMLFISPWVVGFLVFTLTPILRSFQYSLSEYNVISPPIYVGFANYVKMLTRDQLFWKSLLNDFYMVFVGIPIGLVATLSVAILFNSKLVLRQLSFLRVIFFLPTLIPLIVLCLLWIWILEPRAGVINTLLGYVGIKGPGWFADPAWAKPAFILMGIWGAGTSIILYLAALKDVPVSLHEAASIDGANGLRRLWHITLPMLAPVISYSVITGVIATFQQFALSLVMTGGGPNGATLYYSLYLYKNAFSYFQMGYASAMAWILLIIVFLLTALLFRLTDRMGARDG